MHTISHNMQLISLESSFYMNSIIISILYCTLSDLDAEILRSHIFLPLSVVYQFWESEQRMFKWIRFFLKNKNRSCINILLENL